jgi:hypothetical protein
MDNARHSPAEGASKVFAEKLSGASAAKVLGKLEPGDVLLVTRLDRLARSTRDLLNVLDTVSRAGSGFHRLADLQQRNGADASRHSPPSFDLGVDLLVKVRHGELPKGMRCSPIYSRLTSPPRDHTCP